MTRFSRGALNKRNILLIIFVLVIAISFFGCSSAKDKNGTMMKAELASESMASSDRAGGAAVKSDAKASETDSGVTTEAVDSSASKEKIVTTSGEPGDKEEIAQNTAPIPKPGQLTAGVWSDLVNWEFWTNLLNNQEWSDYQNKWMVFPIRRVTVVVKDGDKLVNDAKVVLMGKSGKTLWTAKTSNKGQAELFSGMFDKQGEAPYSITVEANGQNKTIEIEQQAQGTPITVELASGSGESDILDLMFVVDTTGSMGDELEYLKVELKNVVERVKNENHNNINIRVSSNYYRDHGDEYVVRSFPFTNNIDEVMKQINNQSANGGGDFEEAVEEALDDALNKHTWSEKAKARLLFLVLDAPPHNTKEIVEKLHKLIQTAAEKGVRIIPVASSGIDKNTEFLLRYFSVSTGGTYVFLTNHSGIGNGHIEPTIGQYEVEFLNDALVRIVNSYLE